MEKLNIWMLSKQYVDEMAKIEPSIQYPKPNNGMTRPYVGIVFKIHNFLYFAPLTHWGMKWSGFEDHVLLANGEFGSIKLNKMIPIYGIYKDELLIEINIKAMKQSKNQWFAKRGRLLAYEWKFINKPSVTKEILNKAVTVYYNWESLKVKQEYRCDFKKLEYFAINWKFSYWKLFNLVLNFQNNNIY